MLCAGKPISVFYYYVTVRDDFVVHSRFFFSADFSVWYSYTYISRIERCGMYLLLTSHDKLLYIFKSRDRYGGGESMVNFWRDCWSIFTLESISDCFRFLLTVDIYVPPPLFDHPLVCKRYEKTLFLSTKNPSRAEGFFPPQAELISFALHTQIAPHCV